MPWTLSDSAPREVGCRQFAGGYENGLAQGQAVVASVGVGGAVDDDGEAAAPTSAAAGSGKEQQGREAQEHLRNVGHDHPTLSPARLPTGRPLL